MKFAHINTPPSDNPDYHVARADVQAAGDWCLTRMVAYGSTTAEAEETLLAAIPSSIDILDMGSC